MEDSYFSEREVGFPPRTIEKIDTVFWGGFLAIIQSLLNNGSLAESFPENCFEAPVPTSCNDNSVRQVFRAEIPYIEWPLNSEKLPNTLYIIDAVEFFYRYVSKPIDKIYHFYGNHYHFISFNKNMGESEYLQNINRLFRRCNLSYELKEDGKVLRLGPPILIDILKDSIFRSEDLELNHLLQSVREKFLHPDINVRREAVEKLWDAFERLKTLESGQNKKQQIEALLTKAIIQPEFRECVNQEAKILTDIGNNFMIRHTEKNKITISESEYLDYLFHRLFALILMLLKRTNRC